MVSFLGEPRLNRYCKPAHHCDPLSAELDEPFGQGIDM